jgi:hypothetical protein
MRNFNFSQPLALTLSGLLLAACGGSSDSGEPIAFGAEGNRLLAYQTSAPWDVQTVIERRADDPNGWDINGQICFTGDESPHFIAGEDAGQPDPPAGFGFFKLIGETVGNLSAERVGKLTPTYQGGINQAEPYGCGFLSDGRLVTTDVGNQASGPPNGQLILWFPPFDQDDVAYCKLDIAIGTAQQIYVDDLDRIYVSSARGNAGIHRFSPPYPTSNDAAGGCDRRDSTGAPLARSVDHEIFIQANANSPTPAGVAASAHGTIYVSSVLNGVIAEYDDAGVFLGRILEPPPGETLGAEPFTTGTPLGIAVAPDGSIFYADLGLVIDGARIGPGRNTGSFRVIEFADGVALPPRKLADGLAFPDGAGILR